MKMYKAILYSRVSTTHDDQAESIDNQILLARNYLERHPDIELVEPIERYSERYSGKTDMRPKFQELCERLMQGDIDYLLVKDLKRLARSVETTYAFLNIMKQIGFKIIRLDSGKIIDSHGMEEEESNLLIGIEALFAQNVVLTQSRYGKTVQRIRCENKMLTRKDSTLFGYKWNPELKDIIIDEEKAEIVRELYDRYVFRDEGILGLKDYLASIGYRYSIVSIAKWLQETKYIGDWTINRKGSILGIGQGAKTHRFHRDKAEWVHVPRPDLAIIDKEIFDLAQEIRLSRIKTYNTSDGKTKALGSFTGTHLFSGKVVCAECGSYYRFKWTNRAETIAIYYDSYKSRTNLPVETCNNTRFRRIYEDDLKDIVVNAINALNIKGSVSISRMMEAISYAIRSNPEEKQQRDMEAQKLKRLEKEAERITNAFLDAAPAMRSRLNLQLEETERQIEECKTQLSIKKNQAKDGEKLRERLSVIEEQLSGWINITTQNITKKMIDKLISRIVIYPDGRIEIVFTLGGLRDYRIEENEKPDSLQKRGPRVSYPSGKVVHENVREAYREVTQQEKAGSLRKILTFDQKMYDGQGASVEISLTTQK